MIKKFIITTLFALSVVCVVVGISKIDIGETKAKEITQQIEFSETKLNISLTGNKMLIVTAINNTEYIGNVSEIGYTIPGYTLSDTDFAVTTKYYETITIGANCTPMTAVDIGFSKATSTSKLLIWEIAYDSSKDYSITPYAVVHGDGETPIIVNGTAKINMINVIFVNENNEQITTKQVKAGTTLTELPSVPEKEGYEGKWLLGEAEFTSQTVINKVIQIKAGYTDILSSAVTDLTLNNRTINWLPTDEVATSYIVEAVKLGEVINTWNNIEATNFEIPNTLEAGNYTINVYGVNVNGKKGEVSSITYMEIGNAQVLDVSNTNLNYCKEINFVNNTDWEEFITLDTNSSMTIGENGLQFTTTEETKNSWHEATIVLPNALDVKGKDFVLKFELYVPVDNVHMMQIDLYDENDAKAYSFAERKNIWNNPAPYYEGGTEECIGYYTFTMSISSEKLKTLSDNDNKWSDKTADLITKIYFKWYTKDSGAISLTNIKMTKSNVGVNFVNNTDWEEFITLDTDSSMTIGENGLQFTTTEETKNSWHEATIVLPNALDVKGKDFVLKFELYVPVDNVHMMQIDLYDENGAGAYSFAERKNIWNNPVPYYEGGTEECIGYYTFTMSISSEKLKTLNDNDNKWSDKTADLITKIYFKWYTKNSGAISMKSISMVEV